MGQFEPRYIQSWIKIHLCASVLLIGRKPFEVIPWKNKSCTHFDGQLIHANFPSFSSFLNFFYGSGLSQYSFPFESRQPISWKTSKIRSRVLSQFSCQHTLKFLKKVSEGENFCTRGCISSSAWNELSFES